MSRRILLLAAASASALAAPACGPADRAASPQEPTTAASDVVAATTATAEPEQTPESTSTPEDEGEAAVTVEPSDTPSPTTTSPTSPPPATEDDPVAYPEDSIGYARAFLAAWGALDDAAVAEMAVDVVTHGTDSWGTSTTYGRAESCALDHLGADWEGLDLVTVLHPDAVWTDVVVRRDALGSGDAVVGVEHSLYSDRAAPYSRPETVLDAYAREFVEAWTAQDLDTMTRLSDAELAARVLEHSPADPSRAPVWAGFLALEGEPLHLVVQVHTENHGFLDTIGLDPAVVLAGEPHGVVDVNILIDPRYGGTCGHGPVVTEPAP